MRYNTIIQYIIEQANIYDNRNLQFERTILSSINRQTEYLISSILSIIPDIRSILGIQELMMRIEYKFNTYNTNIKKIYNDIYKRYNDIAYKQTDELLELGIQMQRQYNISEFQQKYDPKTIEFIRDRSFELLKGHNYDKVNKIRAKLGDLYLQGRADKQTVRRHIMKILETNKSKAEEIAQTELSRAYNNGFLQRMDEYNRNNPTQQARKYWHGFKYSQKTCSYCEPRIGRDYDLYDNSETLPAHVRCRCIWLPMLLGWDKPVDMDLISRANMLNLVYTPEQLYQRINNRLGINYGEYIDTNTINQYLDGDRSRTIFDGIDAGKQRAIDNIKGTFNIAMDKSEHQMADEFNKQSQFWIDMTAKAMVDGDNKLLDDIIKGVQGVMMLPWSSNQFQQWNRLINIIKYR